MSRRLRFGLVALILGPGGLAAAALEAWGSRPAPAGPYGAIIVAGCRVEPDGQPSVALAARVELALQYAAADPDAVVIFTGGLGEHPPSEAVAAARYAEARGLEPGRVRLEDQSTSTEENACFAAAHFPAERVLVVTSAYHAFRARRVFARYFPTVEVTGAGGDAWPRVRGALREVGAIGLYALRGRL